MSASSGPILITGFMGAGKSTVAAALARALGCAMIDLDQFIEEREGRGVPFIIDANGLDHFRGVETRALQEALESGAARVIALGGGTWTIARNRELIAAHRGLTVWLDAPFELCWKRIEQEDDGPSLRPLARDRQSALELFRARRALYEQAPLHVQVNEESSTEQIVARIVRALDSEVGGP